MFDIGWSELLVIGVVALIVVGPKDLPRMFRTLGEFTGRARKMAREFQTAMNQAADESGVGDIAGDLRKIANPKKFGTDAFKDATADLRAWRPDDADGSPKLARERAAAKAAASPDAAPDAAEASAEPDLLPDPAAAAPKAPPAEPAAKADASVPATTTGKATATTPKAAAAKKPATPKTTAARKPATPKKAAPEDPVRRLLRPQARRRRARAGAEGVSAAEEEVDDSAAPLIEHLAELRTRLIRSVAAFLIAMVVCFVVAEPILKFLLLPIEDTMRRLGNPNPVMQYTAPQEYFFTLIRVSVVAALIVAFPVIAHQLWRFVAPGLYRKEKAAFLPFLVASPVLFLTGAAFAHYVVVPLAMQFFLGFADAASILAALVQEGVDGVGDTGIDIVFQGKVNESLDITLKMIVAFGLCFQLPVLLTLMGQAGLVSSEGLAGVRKYAVVAILLVAALVTPPDVITQLILFVVVYGLYEISIWLVRMVERKRDASLRAEGLLDEDEGA